MMYQVKEIFHTLQGEGFHSGRAAVFLRFSGCNLWNGREEDRASSICQFCDTDFVGTNGTSGGKYKTAAELAETVAECWSAETECMDATPYVVCTGGEPLLQLDAELITALQGHGFEVAVETNGTIDVPAEINWVCCSPKAGSKLVVSTGDELKLVYPQIGISPESLVNLDFRHFYLQPMDGNRLSENTAHAINYCRKNPRWRLSTQMHKIAGIR